MGMDGIVTDFEDLPSKAQRVSILAFFSRIEEEHVRRHFFPYLGIIDEARSVCQELKNFFDDWTMDSGT